MKKESRLTKQSLIALDVLFALLGAAVALFTYFRYTICARAIVGLAVPYLILNRNAFRDLYGPIETLLAQPNKPRAFLTMSVAGTISTWAAMQVAEAVIFYLKR